MLEPLRNLNITEPHFVSPFFSLCLLLLEEVVPHLPLPLSLARLIGSVLFWPENVNFFFICPWQKSPQYCVYYTSLSVSLCLWTLDRYYIIPCVMWFCIPSIHCVMYWCVCVCPSVIIPEEAHSSSGCFWWLSVCFFRFVVESDWMGFIVPVCCNTLHE